MSKKEQQYCIEAYPYTRPQQIDRGVLEKGSGKSIIAGESVKVLNRRSEVGLPNWTEAWGARLDGDGKIPSSPLDVKDPKYKGQIKELEWGHKDGYLIVCRYLRGYNTIDQQYQDVILNAKETIRDDSESSADAYYIRIQSGDNFFDPESEPYLCQMFRIHYMNESSKYRSPESQSAMFREKDYAAKDTQQSKTLSSKFQALKIVNDASNDNTLSSLRNLKSVVQLIVKEEVQDEDLYRSLSLLADAQPDEFLKCVNDYKRVVSDSFEKAKSYSAIDLTTDGKIAAGQLKKEVIGTDIPAKKEGMLDWVLENFLDAKANEIIHRLKKITDSLN